MPRIRPYESQVSSQGDLPSRSAGMQDFGGSGLSNLGQGIENLGASAGQAQRILNEAKARQEVTDEHIAHIDSVSRLTQQIDEKAKNYVAVDPETGRRNPTISELAPGLVKAELDQRGLTEDGGSFYETGAGQNAFRTNAAQLSQHFVDVSRQIDSKLAGEAAVQKFNSATDKMGAHVFAHPVPAAVDFAMQKAKELVADPNGEFAGIGKQHQDGLLRKMQESIAVRAVEGSIRQFPNQTLKLLTMPPDDRDTKYNYIAAFVPSEKIGPLINQAETEVRAGEIEAARAQAEENRRRIEMARTSETGLIEKLALHMEDSKQPMISARDVLDSNLYALDPEKGKAMLSLIHAWSKEDPHRPTHTDPSTMREIVRDIHRPDGDPRKLADNTRIYKAYDRGMLSFTDLKQLNTEFNDARTSDGQKFGQSKEKFITSMAPQIDHSNPMMGKMDRTGKKNVYEFEQTVNRKVEEYRKAGKDIYSLFDPEAPDYMGRPERLKPFQKHMMDSIREFSEGMRNAPPAAPAAAPAPEKARKPGESPQQFLDRMKKQ